MNYCDYYLKVLSLYISRSLMSLLDFAYTPGDREFWIWDLEVDNRAVVLYPQSDSLEAYPPVESTVDDSGHTSLFLIHGRKKPPEGYRMTVML